MSSFDLNFTALMGNFLCSFPPYPFSFFSFIENFGTHIVTSATIGGRDVVYIRQHQSSPLSTLDIENYVEDIGDHRFQDSKSQSSAGPLKYKDKVSIFVHHKMVVQFHSFITF